LLGLWLFIGIRFHFWTYRAYDRYVWLAANLPVARSLWHGEIKAGDDVEELIKIWRPHMITRCDRWVELRWFPGGPSQDTISFIGICVVAKDGKLASATSYADDGVLVQVFFSTLTSDETSELRTSLKAHANQWRAESQRQPQQIDPTNASHSMNSETNGKSSTVASPR